MKFIIALALLALAGCDSITDLGGVANSYGDGSVCNYYPNASTTAEIDDMAPIDSTKICPDGTTPVLYKTTWIVTGNDCDDPYAIVGGIKGIHRQFGCWKTSKTTLPKDPF